MPLYEYECDACQRRFEMIQKFSDAPPESCQKCGKGPVRRLLSSPAIQFKGTGWYITDYSQKGKSGTTENGGGAKADTSEKAPSSDAATKTESSPSTDSKAAKSTDKTT